MAKRKSRRRRKNPLGSEAVMGFLKGKSKDAGSGPLQNNVVRALVAGAGGGAAMAFGAAVAGKRLGETNVAQALVGIGGGLVGAAVLGFAGSKLKQPAIAQAAPLVAAGAVSLSVWELVRDPIVEQIGMIRDNLLGGAAGLGAWDQEFAGYLGQSYHDEYKVGATGAGLGAGPNEPVVSNPFTDDAGSMGSYEPLGDIYHAQRLGSFESEAGFGAHEAVPDCNPMHQQCADLAKHQAGLQGYGGYAGAGMEDTLFESAF